MSKFLNTFNCLFCGKELIFLHLTKEIQCSDCKQEYELINWLYNIKNINEDLNKYGILSDKKWITNEK